MVKSVKIPFALSVATGSIVHVDDVESGFQMEFVCHQCAAPLVAKKGNINQHHFAHYAGESCNPSYETALHKYAKEILKSKKIITLPEYCIEYDGDVYTALAEGLFEFDVICTETKFDKYIADAIASISGKDLVIEFSVTHKCEAEKVKHIIDNNISAIEIDLSSRKDYQFDDRDRLDDYILNRSPRVWMHNSTHNFHYEKIKKSVEEKRQKIKREIEIIKKNRESFIRNLMDLNYNINANGKSPVPERLIGMLRNSIYMVNQHDLFMHVGREMPHDDCFLVSAKGWQSMVLSEFVIKKIDGSSRNSIFNIGDVNRWLKRLGFVHKLYQQYFDDYAVYRIRERFLDFTMPYELIAEYLGILANDRILVRLDKGFIVNSYYFK